MRTAALALLLAAPVSAEGLWPDLSSPLKTVGGGEKDAAVIVGVQSYAAVAPVPGALQNAEDWHSYLTGTLKVPLERVALLRDNEATRELIEDKVREAASQVEPGGTLWFVYIGHGAPSKDGSDGLLVGWDAQQRADSLFSRSLPQKALLRDMAAGKQARSVVLIDACFSGRTPEGAPLIKGLQPLILKAGGSAQALSASRAVVLTAARSDQFAGPLPGQARPAFSYLALGALRGWAAEGARQVSAEGIVAYVGKALRALQTKQEPELVAFSGGQTFAAGAEAGPDLGALVRKTGPVGAKKGGVDFQVSALPAVPIATAPEELDVSASGLDLSNVDVDALGKYDAVFKFEKGEGSAGEKAERWRGLAKEAPAYAALAAKRAEDWDRYAVQKKAAEEALEKRFSARDADWEKLSRLLGFSVVPEADKKRWSEQFAAAYEKSPGLAAGMAQSLSEHIPAGPARSALLAAAKSSRAPRKAGVEWVEIPGGSFMMGRNDLPSWGQPMHRVTIKAFEMAKTLVTNRQYKACLAAGACTAPKASCFLKELAGDDQPVVCVDKDQAEAFCKWVGGRLPTESEYEYAARSAGKDRMYPWGDEPATCDRVVFEESGTSGCGRQTSWPVCSKPRGNSDQGLCDIVGNANEWTEDWFHDSYAGAPEDGSAWMVPVGTLQTARGGSWKNPVASVGAAYRGTANVGGQSGQLGFRPVRPR